MRTQFEPKFVLHATTALALSLGTQAVGFEGEVPPDTVVPSQTYSPFVDRSYPDQVLFGDLHFHTEISFDAGLVGDVLEYPRRLPRGARGADNFQIPDNLYSSSGHSISSRLLNTRKCWDLRPPFVQLTLGFWLTIGVA